MQQTIELWHAWSQAVSAGEVEDLMDLYHPHALLETPIARAHGVEEIQAMLGATLWRKWRNHEIVVMRQTQTQLCMMTQHGEWTAEHTMQIYEGAIRAHQIELRRAN